MIESETQFYNDRQIADLLGVSTSWVRLQRFNRRHGRPHTFDLDPVQVGYSPRYLRQEFDAFLTRLINHRDRASDGLEPAPQG